jgi:hypothetical protein
MDCRFNQQERRKINSTFLWGEEAHVTSGPSHEIKVISMAKHCTEEENLINLNDVSHINTVSCRLL